MSRVVGFIRFSRQMLGPWGQVVTVVFALFAAAVAALGSEELRSQDSTAAQLLTIAPWYTWMLIALSSALLFALVRGYVIIELRTRGFQILLDRGELGKAYGSLDSELRDVERVWLMCPVATTLHASGSAVLDKIDRAILADIHDGVDFAPYSEMLLYGSKIFRPNLYWFSRQLQRAGKEVKWHKHPPIGAVIANPRSANGWVRLELILPYVESARRPNLKVFRRDRPELVDRVVQMFEDTWSRSVVPDWEALPDLYPATVETESPSSTRLER